MFLHPAATDPHFPGHVALPQTLEPVQAECTRRAGGKIGDRAVKDGAFLVGDDRVNRRGRGIGADFGGHVSSRIVAQPAVVAGHRPTPRA